MPATATFPEILKEPFFAALDALFEIWMVVITLTLTPSAMLAGLRHGTIDYQHSDQRNPKKNLHHSC